MTDKKDGSAKEEPDGGAPHSRRQFLFRLASFSAALGAPIPFGTYLPFNVTPIALAQASSSALGKPGLRVLSERPLNMETPPSLLDDDITPASRMFVRNNGVPPAVNDDILHDWTLTIDGLVDNPLALSIADLKSSFENVTLQLQLECGGNGRKYFSPGVSGNQWTFGAIGCPEWTGVRLRDVLQEAGVKSEAVYTAHYSADAHLSGDTEKDAISRGVPIAKARDPHTLIAWAMNGEDMPLMNGHPLRLVAPGWPGSCSQKWLTRITLRDQVHDGAKMTGYSYRVPAYPVAPGAEVSEEDMVIIESMPVKSLITYPETGVRHEAGSELALRGSAWAGERDIEAVEISIDFGATWRKTNLSPLANKFAWRRWNASVVLPEAGYYEIWARATDSEGVQQPPITLGWNPRGYLNNMQHRVAIYAV